MTEHTSGPWIVFVGPEGFSVLPAGRSGSIAGPIDSASDADLIAAAPDMLAELQRMEQRMVRLIDSGDCGHWESDKDEDVISMRKIIARATGAP